MSSRYCLDTSAYSNLQRGDERVAQLVRSAEWIGLPSIVIGELRTGFRLGDRQAANDRRLDGFLAHPVVEELLVDRHVAELYAAIVVELRRRGTPVPTNDLWIAALTMRAGAPVLTYDEHFRTIPHIEAVVPESP